MHIGDRTKKLSTLAVSCPANAGTIVRDGYKGI